MSIDPIQLIQVDGISNSSGIDRNGMQPATDFVSWLDGQVSEANKQILDADVQLRKLAIGESENIHQVMMALEKAKTSFQLTLQVRNKLLEAYQEILRMQI